jgi:hypothetical protein
MDIRNRKAIVFGNLHQSRVVTAAHAIAAPRSCAERNGPKCRQHGNSVSSLAQRALGGGQTAGPACVKARGCTTSPDHLANIQRRTGLVAASSHWHQPPHVDHPAASIPHCRESCDADQFHAAAAAPDARPRLCRGRNRDRGHRLPCTLRRAARLVVAAHALVVDQSGRSALARAAFAR